MPIIIDDDEKNDNELYGVAKSFHEKENNPPFINLPNLPPSVVKDLNVIDVRF